MFGVVLGIGMFVVFMFCAVFISDKSKDFDEKLRAGHREVENKRMLAQRHGMVLHRELYLEGTEEYTFPPSLVQRERYYGA